jgi:energy-coupling factor transporter ATP-binding protein EcfA2/SAM-dependent methyltransferase
VAITSLHVDARTYEEFGVGPWELPSHERLNMRGLGKVVLLAGPNGGGKSRILRVLNQLIRRQLTPDQIAELERQLRQYQPSVEHWRNVIRDIDRRRQHGEQNQQLEDEKKSGEASVASLESQMRGWQRQLLSRQVMTRSTGEVPPVVLFVPSQYRLVDPGSSSDDEVKRRADQIRQGQGSEKAETNAPAYAREVLRSALWGLDPQHTGEATIKISVEEDAASLKRLVAEILGPSFSLALDRTLNITIGGHRDYSSALSPGQQILFQFVCLLHAQGSALRNCIVLMDEPENHLHPEAITQIVDRLRAKIDTGQLWIATHSVPLIAQLVATETNCLWYVQGGNARRAGRSPESVLVGLMGGPDGARHIKDLTLLPAQFAALRFLTECLGAPTVVEANLEDPQLCHIGRILCDRRNRDLRSSKRFRVLDFGAGKGRLMSALGGLGEAQIEYFAYERDPAFAEHCRLEAARSGGDKLTAHCFSDLHELVSSIDRETVDVVVMCNVLHEIPPDEWLGLFGSDGKLSKLLHKDGQLLLVEDYGLPIGERAHEFGFLLLDGPELRQLFQVTENDVQVGAYVRDQSDDAKYKGRLVAHLIAKQCVERVTRQSQVEAIRALKDRAMASVHEFLRDHSGSSKSGRSYALSAQLLANATIWLTSRGST